MPLPRILSIFNRYLQYGGEETIAGHMANVLSQRARVTEFNYSTEEWLAAGRWTAPFRGLDNRRVVHRLRSLQQEHDFDVWLIHNVFPAMSPAAYREAGRLGVPVIHVIHNYRFGCLNGLLFRDGRDCMDCIDGRFFPGIVHRCWKNGLASSLYAASFLTLARHSGILDDAAQFLAQSSKQAELMKRMGIPESKTTVLSLFVETYKLPYTAPPTDGDILFVGRLSPEKGLLPVLNAWSRLDTDRRLVIVGDGPQRQELESFVRGHQLNNVVFKGFIPLEDQAPLWESASVFIAPSICYETGAATILEAMGRGRPVMAIAKGAACDHLADPMHGWLIRPDDPDDLLLTLQKVLDTPADILDRMGRQSREFIREYRSPKSWLDGFMDVVGRIVHS